MVTVAPGHSYTLSSYPCLAGETVSVKVMVSGDTIFSYLQDYNLSLIDLLYITQCQTHRILDKFRSGNRSLCQLQFFMGSLIANISHIAHERADMDWQRMSLQKNASECHRRKCLSRLNPNSHNC